jgi:type I restriction enzyme S subunit
MKQGWEIKRLDDVCEFGNGLWTGKKPPFEKVGVIRNTNFTRDGRLDDSDIVYLDVEQSQFIKRKLQYGDIILEKSGGGPKQPVGRVIIFDKKEGDFSFSNFTSVIRILNPKTTDFSYLHRFLLFSYISGATETMQSNSTGIRNLKFDDYKAIEIPLPPLQEQKRIVAILDEAFGGIAKAKANAEQNLKNAKELFESYLQGVFENKGEGWEEKTLGDVCSLYQGIAINAKTKHSLVEISDLPLLRIKDLKNNTVEQFIDPNNYPVNALVNKEDIIYTRTGSLGLVFRGKRGVLHNNSFKVVPNSKLTNDYLFIWLQNPIFKSRIMELALKAAQPDITHAIFKKQKIAIPPINEQNKIVQKLDALSAETKKLEAIYQTKINDLEELKKSVLQKAFSGELKTEKEVTV